MQLGILGAETCKTERVRVQQLQLPQHSQAKAPRPHIRNDLLLEPAYESC